MLLKKHHLDGFFISSVPSITYLTHFSGFDNEDRNAFLLITAKNQYIFTHGIYKEAVKKYIKGFTLVDIERNQPLSGSLGQLIQKHKVKKLGIEADDLTYMEYLSLTKKIEEEIFIPSDIISEHIRIKKSPEEIRAIEKACMLGDKAFTYLLTKIKEGMSEKELAMEYEFFVKKAGADISFTTIIAFGSNGSLPHHVPTDKKLSKNTFIVLDFGVKLNNYCSDMTRTVFFGKANEKQKKMYETVLTAQQLAIDYIARFPIKLGMTKNEILKQVQNDNGKIRNDIHASEADKIARDYIISKGYPSMPHSLGHGIGLLVHEQPRLSPHSTDILSEGMVFSIEPGIYIPEVGGVRIEDLITIRNGMVKLLTKAPKHLIELS